MIFRSLAFLGFCSIMCACSSYTKIGDVTVVSTRNFDSKTNYVELRRYVKSYGKTTKDENAFESAIDEAVRQVPGGEFLKNCTIYIKGEKIKLEADVWGISGKEVQLTDKAYDKLNKRIQKKAYKAAKDSL